MGADSDDDIGQAPTPPPVQPAQLGAMVSPPHFAGGHAQHAQGLQLSTPPGHGLPDLRPHSPAIPCSFSPYDPAIWGAPTIHEQQLGLRGGAAGPPLTPPITAPPPLPPRGSPVLHEPPPPALQAPPITSDPYYVGGYPSPATQVGAPSVQPVDAYGMPAYGGAAYGDPPGYAG